MASQQPVLVLAQDEVVSWESKLSFLQEGLLLLQGIQRKWLYLAPIFARGALPQQQGRFRHVDSEYRTIMSQLEVSCRVQVCVGRMQCTFTCPLQMEKSTVL